MRFNVQVSQDRGRNRVEVTDDWLYVSLRANSAKENTALVCVLAKHFGVRSSTIKIVDGDSSQTKIVEIEKDPN